MEKDPEKAVRAVVRQQEDADARTPSRKKTYRKPELVKHEQLHGIGLGSP